MPNTPLPPLAAPPDLAARLQVPTPTEPAVLAAWEAALEDASNTLRDVIGQPLTPGSCTLPVTVNELGAGLIPICPVVAVTAVVDPNGATLPADGTGYQVDGQRLTIYPPYLVYNTRAPLDPIYKVTLDHGWDPIPGELLRWTYALAAAQVANSAVGNLGVAGGVSAVSIDDGRVSFNPGTSSAIPDRQMARLRAMYGGEA